MFLFTPFRLLSFSILSMLMLVYPSTLGVLGQDTSDVLPSSPCWTYRSDYEIVSAASDSSKIYLVKEGARLEALSLVTGERIWTAEYGGQVTSNVAHGGNQIFIATANSGQPKTKSAVVRSISASTGITNWVTSLNADGVLFLGLSGTSLIAVSNSGAFVSLRIGDGAKTGEKLLDSEVSAGPVMVESQIAVGTRDKKIRLLSATNLTEVLALSVPNEAGSIAMDEANLYWGDDRGNVSAYDIENTSYRWQLKQGGRTIGLLPTRDGLAVASADNFVYLASSNYGNIKWKRRLSNRITSITDWGNDFFIVLDASGEQAYVLDEKKGRIVIQALAGESKLFNFSPSVSGDYAVLFTPDLARGYRLGGCVQK